MLDHHEQHRGQQDNPVMGQQRSQLRLCDICTCECSLYKIVLELNGYYTDFTVEPFYCNEDLSLVELQGSSPTITYISRRTQNIIAIVLIIEGCMASLITHCVLLIIN